MSHATKFDPLGKTAAVAIAAVLVTGAAACDGGVSGPDQGSLTVRLTDAAGDLEAAWISVTEVQLAGESEGSSGPATLPTETGDGLIRLSDDAVTDLVTGAAVQPGTYGQLRLVIDGGVVETTDGRVFTFGGAEHPDGDASDGSFMCPSCTETGVKVNLGDGGLQIEAESTILMLDFNIPESFGREAGRSGSFVMRPTITSSVVDVSGNITGSVSVADGVTIPDCGGAARSVADFIPKAVLSSDGSVSQTAAVTADDDAGTEGSYSIDFLEPGDYDMTFVSDVDFSTESGTETLTFGADVEPGQVEVQSGRDATADYTVTSASCSSS